MAKNIKFAGSKRASLVCSDPAIPASGDPVICGQIPGVALTKEAQSIAGETTVGLDDVAEFSVKGEYYTGSAKANQAVAVGDILYYNAADTPKLNKDNRGVRFGYAREVVTSGATTSIDVQIGY